MVNRQALHRTIDGPLAMFVWNETNSPTMAAKAPNPAAVATVAPNDRRTSRAVAAGMTMTASRSGSGRFYRTDPNDSRLLFAPTGRNLQRGEGYFADYFVFFPTVAYGVTDFLALSGGVSLIPGASSQVIYFAPKLAFNLSPTVSIATGGLYVTIPDEISNAFLAYAVTTIGKRTGAVTLGIGIPVSESTGSPLLLLGGELQISNSAKLISENWIFTGSPDTEIAFSGGVRFFGDKIAVDLAMVSTGELLSSGGFPFFPWVDFAVSFGK